MQALAVFCGSSQGAHPSYMKGAQVLGEQLAKRSITLIYGGSSIGLMGAVADSTLANGGKVIGVIPKFLQDKEIAHPNLSDLVIVDSMHERKHKMEELADGFIMLPGGCGTLEEFFEVFTWGQLGLHQKPIGILNIDHYFDLLISLIAHMNEQQFLQDKFLKMALVSESPADLIQQFYTYTPPEVKTFIRKSQT
ncbi:TIGR00730 family Rossman fold protein [Cytobacillus kochii]|uniref:LOG family protein n=1 Tax=Cytobacillus TaxID=2675230 RepID=UPI002AFF03F9|nr:MULTISPECIES: TIGR00730 family Rossman fold protein [Cytobacillus]MEA1854167.1 TIGR00730 family Rossman fold protein [Cytobacillus sp. OWB-43]MED1607214.1 TIGR00730 family Rossman fold protein [Cytobacillus kochii]